MDADRSSWPKWPRPGDRLLLALVKKVTPFVRFLDPEIIAEVVEDNDRHRVAWRKKLRERDVNPDIYLWKGSPCAFPGIRRHAGKRELSYFNGIGEAGKPPDVLAIDGNTYPKQIWSFVLRGKRFQNSGPDGYALAHLADHKAYKNRLLHEFDMLGPHPEKLYGLYTAASNTAYMPDNLLNLTDFNLAARLLLLNKAQALYGRVCNIVPPGLAVKPPQTGWPVEDFDWSDPVKAAFPVRNFLDFRLEVLRGL